MPPVPPEPAQTPKTHAGKRPLLVVASATEAERLLPPLEIDAAGAEWRLLGDKAGTLEAVVTGVGKANSAGGLARVLDPSRHAWVLVAGIGGALPGSQLEIGDVVVGTESVFADEGVQMRGASGGFRSITDLGFGLIGNSDRAGSTPDLVQAFADAGCLTGSIATVSTCSGTDERAKDIRERTGAIVEAMEGAAALGVAARLGVPAVEVRGVSNRTGEREEQGWDLELALSRLNEVIGRVLGEVLGR